MINSVRKYGFCAIVLFTLAGSFGTGLPYVSHAQERDFFQPGQTFRGGVVAGVNFTELIGDAYHGLNKKGIKAGGVVYARFSDNIAATTGILYSQKGSLGNHKTFTSSGDIFWDTYRVQLDYIELPLQIVLIPHHSLQFGGGCSYGFLLRSREAYEADQPRNIDPDIHEFRQLDFMWLLSTYVRIYKELWFAVQYQRSLGVVRMAEKIPQDLGSGDQFNKQLSFSFSWMFR